MSAPSTQPPRPAPPQHPPMDHGAPRPAPGCVAQCYHCGCIDHYGAGIIVERCGSHSSYGYAYACSDSVACWDRWNTRMNTDLELINSPNPHEAALAASRQRQEGAIMSAFDARPSKHPCPLCGLPMLTRAALSLHYSLCWAERYGTKEETP